MSAETKELEVVDWGLLEYQKSFGRQIIQSQKRIAGEAVDTLVLVEHPPTVTMGRRANETDLLIPETLFQHKGVALQHIDRGGQATVHEPGQMVAYPIIEVQDRDLHRYVERLLETLIRVLRHYGLEAKRKKGEPGLWVDGRKIASLGIAVKKWVTSHGIALNVNNDLSTFDLIVPCGKPGEKITSISKELGHEIDMEELKQLFVAAFRDVFGYTVPVGRHPEWLKLSSQRSQNYTQLKEMLGEMQLETVCQSAHCPNLGECFSRGTATFMILGSECTRQCRFCAVDKGCPAPVDPEEPTRVAAAAKKMGLKYVVVTSVTRDDLSDGGSGHFASTIKALHETLPDAQVEVLIPDFQGCPEALETVFAARSDVLNHNIETVPRLYAEIRAGADYQRSLEVLRAAADYGLKVKSGLMLGLGERPNEVEQTLLDMRHTGCDLLTIGQYLAPSERHAPVVRYIPPKEFDNWDQKARAMGFKEVASGALVRSSYRADELVHSTHREI